MATEVKAKADKESSSTEKKYSMFVGRWQPLHAGHLWLINQRLKEGYNVWLAIRDVKPDLEKTSKIKLNANKSNTSIDHWILWESLVNDNFEFFQSEWWLDVCQRLNNEYSSYLKLKQKKINLI